MPSSRHFAWLAVASALGGACRDGQSSERSAPSPSPSPSPGAVAQPAAVNPSDAAPPPPPPEPMRFEGACDPGKTAVIAVVGDVLIHKELAIQAFAHRRGFRSLWAGIGDLIDGADVTYANLEGPMAPGIDDKGFETEDPGLEFDDVVYTGYPKFNFHPSLAVDLRRAGFDVVSTANNHVFDREYIGVDKTIDALREARLKYAGTRRFDEGTEGGYAITRADRLKIAWVACTAFTNLYNKTETDQLIRCDLPEGGVTELVTELARRRDVDAVIVTPHWGREGVVEPSDRQVKWAHEWLDAGATAVIGSHSHVLGPWEQYRTRDKRQTLVIYSLGNFVSHQPELAQRSTAIVYIGLTRGKRRKTRINGARYVPLHVRQTDQRFYVEAIDRVGGPADARAHVTSTFPAGNVMHPDENFVTNPECAAP